MKRLIFGCGYVGQRIGRKWAEAGDHVFGVTRKKTRFAELQQVGIEPILGDVTDCSTLGGLPACDTVLVAVGMDRSTYSDIRQVYVEGMQHILGQLPTIDSHLIYVSSTGVYGDFEGEWVTENSPTSPLREGGKACLEAEQLIQSSKFKERYSILRFAGIYGEARVPMKAAIANGDWSKLNPKGHLNLIHVNDGVNILFQIAADKPVNGVLLVSDGHPPLRVDYYEQIAELTGSRPIDWQKCEFPNRSSRSSDKKISNGKLLERLSYEFKFPDYRTGLRDALAGEI